MGNTGNSGMNKVTIIGHIGADPSYTPTTTGGVCTMSICSNETIKTNKNGVTQEKDISEWHRCVAFGKLANIINNYGTVGRYVLVEGRITSHSYMGKIEVTLPNGAKVVGEGKKYSTEIRINYVKFLDSPKTLQQPSPPPYDDNDIPF